MTANGKLPKGYVRLKDGRFYKPKTGAYVGGFNAYYPNRRVNRIQISHYAMSNDVFFEAILGHELIHAYHNHIGLRDTYGSGSFKLYSENEAHSFSAETLKPYISRSNWYERKYNHHVNIVNQKYMYDHPAFTNPFQ